MFVTNHINKTTIPVLSKDYLIDLGVTIIGDILAIIQHAKSLSEPFSEATSTTINAYWVPQTTTNNTCHDKSTILQIPNWLGCHKLMLSYTASVRIQFKAVLSIPVETYSFSVKKIWLKSLKPLRLNTPVLQYIVSTLLTYQKRNLCKTCLIVWLNSIAQDCGYSRSCQANEQSIHVKGQFIQGLHSETSQTFLPRQNILNVRIIKHAEAFESALWDQAHWHQQTDSVAQISAYKEARSNASKHCSGCGTTNYTNSQCSTVCPAWGKQCLNCNNQYNFAKVCCQTTQSQGRLCNMRHAIACACLCACLKHWRHAKKSTPYLIKKASRCAADCTSKTTTLFIFHILYNTKILRENQMYLFVISLVQWWKFYYQRCSI